MNRGNTRKLCDDFPELDLGRKHPFTGKRSPFVFEHEDGWFDIVYQLSRDITEMAHQAQVEGPEVTQVKEKFGALRFYLGPVNKSIADAVFELVNQAEETSRLVCEGCGIASHVHAHNGWYTTLCDTCLAQRLKDHFYGEVETTRREKWWTGKVNLATLFQVIRSPSLKTGINMT